MSHLEHRYLVFMFLAYSVSWLLALGFLYRMYQKARAMERVVYLLRTDLATKTVQPGSAQDQSSLPGPSV